MFLSEGGDASGRHPSIPGNAPGLARELDPTRQGLIKSFIEVAAAAAVGGAIGGALELVKGGNVLRGVAYGAVVAGVGDCAVQSMGLVLDTMDGDPHVSQLAAAGPSVAAHSV